MTDFIKTQLYYFVKDIEELQELKGVRKGELTSKIPFLLFVPFLPDTSDRISYSIS
jgi:hypothetical protein